MSQSSNNDLIETLNNDDVIIRERRMATLVGLWNQYSDEGIFNKKNWKLSVPLANEVVEHYLIDRTIMKTRYNIHDRIQAPKVAGLMTSILLRYRPVIPIVDRFPTNEIYTNENFAILHGLAICGQFSSSNELSALISEEWFDNWREGFAYLLHHRNYTSEALVLVYETLAITKFPLALKEPQ